MEREKMDEKLNRLVPSRARQTSRIICAVEMWRQSNFWDNLDSDLSISDDEELDLDFPRDHVSFVGRDSEEKEVREGIPLQSRLEMLRGVVQSYGRKDEFPSKHTSEQTNFCADDDVEIPDSPCEGDGTFSGTALQCVRNAEFISGYRNGDAFINKEENKQLFESPDASGTANDHDGFGTGEKDETNTWSVANQEAEALLYLNNVSCLPIQGHCKADKSCSKSKGRSRFLFRYQSHKEVACPSISEEENEFMPKPLEIPETSRTFDTEASPISEPSEGSLQEREKQLVMVTSEPEFLDQELTRQSMFDILDSLNANRSHLRENFQLKRIGRGKSEQLALKKSLHTLDDHDLDVEDSPENMDEWLSSDEEVHCRDIDLAVPEKKGTMTERFQIAIGSSYEHALVVAPNSSGTGLFGRLKNLMQREKEMDAVFLKKPNIKSDEWAFDVKIISRYLDAKLTVCHCSLVETLEWHDSPKRIQSEEDMTVIFSPRICSDVDLEVGNTIRIYNPWKEVPSTGSKEKVVLSAYFSQISA